MAYSEGQIATRYNKFVSHFDKVEFLELKKRVKTKLVLKRTIGIGLV